MAPDGNGDLCGKPAAHDRAFGGTVFHLCEEHTQEVDEDAIDDPENGSDAPDDTMVP
jgi:hypothetical protein